MASEKKQKMINDLIRFGLMRFVNVITIDALELRMYFYFLLGSSKNVQVCPSTG